MPSQADLPSVRGAERTQTQVPAARLGVGNPQSGEGGGGIYGQQEPSQQLCQVEAAAEASSAALRGPAHQLCSKSPLQGESLLVAADAGEVLALPVWQVTEESPSEAKGTSWFRHAKMVAFSPRRED